MTKGPIYINLSIVQWVDRSSSELGSQTLGEAFASFAPSVRLETEGKVTLVMASHGLNSLQSFD